MKEMASSIIDEFIQGLDEEIEAIKKGRGGSVVKVFNGRFLREISGLFVYVFNLENFLAVLDDSPAEIEIRGSRYPAQVLLTQRLEVEIGIEHFCGQFISEATLQTNLWYLLELLKKKFTECRSGSAKIESRLSEVLFSGSQSHWKATNQTECRYSLGKEPPNEAQRQAIESSFSSQLAIIWGPPGTGKTKTVAKAIEAHLNAGRRVLLVSHANNAVDEALEDVAEHLKGTPFYQEGKLIRLGKPQEDHFKKLEREYELVLLENIAAKLGESLTQEKNSLESEKAQLEDSLTRFEDAFRALQRVDAILSELDGLRLSLSESETLLRMAQADLNMLGKSQIRNREKLLEAQSAGRLKRFFTGLDPQKLQYEIDQTTISIDSKMRLVREISGRLSELRSYIKAKEGEAKTAKTEVDDLLQYLGVSTSELEGKKKEFDQRKDTILARIAEINRQLDEIQKNVLSEARLVATTLTKTFVAKQFPDVPFDVLVVDEASMAPLPHLYWAASRCREVVTIVGDFLQLPPICIAHDKPMAQKWLGRSIFAVLGIHSVGGACDDPRVKLLDTQYRMAPEISAIPNHFFYQNKLKDDPRT
ncbi:MAG: AAA family ATPase, partial [Dehalococcoidia bacterium]|nr:AAA family ATPase [Dehalococcoidia bacterium]